MACRMIIRGQMAEDRGQRVEAAMPQLIIADKATSHSTRLTRNVSQVAGYAFCLLSSTFCYAEDFPDPTRPPASIFAPVAGVGTGALTTRDASGYQTSGLHTIIISPTRRAAIIDGKTVELGGEHGGAKLIEVNESNVVLQHANSRQVMRLFPDVKITRKEMPDTKSQVTQPSSTSKVQSRKLKAKSTAHHKKLMSGHPKEGK